MCLQVFVECAHVYAARLHSQIAETQVLAGFFRSDFLFGFVVRETDWVLSHKPLLILDGHCAWLLQWLLQVLGFERVLRARIDKGELAVLNAQVLHCEHVLKLVVGRMHLLNELRGAGRHVVRLNRQHHFFINLLGSRAQIFLQLFQILLRIHLGRYELSLGFSLVCGWRHSQILPRH